MYEVSQPEHCAVQHMRGVSPRARVCLFVCVYVRVITCNWSELVSFCSLYVYPVDVLVVFVYVLQ